MISQLVPNKSKIQATFSIFFLLHKTVCPGLQKGWSEKVKVIMKYPQGKKRGGGEGGRVLGWIFAGYVPLASQNPYLIAVFSVANHRPHIRQFWANVFFVIPKNQFLIMHLPLFTSLQEFSFTPNPKNAWPHSSNSIENATPQIVIQSWIFFYPKSQKCMTPF